MIMDRSPGYTMKHSAECTYLQRYGFEGTVERTGSDGRAIEKYGKAIALAEDSIECTRLIGELSCVFL
jgi:hypothetical protein